MRLFVVKLLFHLRHGLLLQLPIELVASLNVRPVFASNELLSVLASFARRPMLYSPKGGVSDLREELILTIFDTQDHCLIHSNCDRNR